MDCINEEWRYSEVMIVVMEVQSVSTMESLWKIQQVFVLERSVSNEKVKLYLYAIL